MSDILVRDRAAVGRIIVDLLLVAVTLALAVVAVLQWRTLQRQTEIQGLLSRPTIAPAYTGKVGTSSLIVSLRNTGATPARGVRIARVSSLLTNPQQGELDALCAGTTAAAGALVIHSHGIIEHHVPMPARSPGPGQTFFICGYVLYSDGGDSDYTEPFCFSLNDQQLKSKNDHTICSLSRQGN